jgi:ADP-ribose pyrophosphatase YjhB (NUDIX family)
VPAESPAPRIVVAVGAIVVDGEGILLIQRGHPPAEGRWSIPGGRVETGETLPQAVRREIQEECGLDVAVGDIAIVLDRISRDPIGRVQSHYLILDFWATPATGRAPPIVRASSDAADAGWFTLDEARQLATTTNLVDYLEEALRRRAAGIPGCLVVGD